MTRAVLLCVLAGACVDVPRFPGLRVVGCPYLLGEPVVEGCTLAIQAPELELRFAPRGSRLAIHLGRGDGPNLLARADDDRYSAIGLALEDAPGAPDVSLNGVRDDGFDGELVVRAAGPAFAQLSVVSTWTGAQPTCGAITTVTSWFTAFPDGRVLRSEAFSLGAPVPACSNLRGYVSVRTDALPTAQWYLASGGSSFGPSAQVELDGPARPYDFQICAHTGTSPADADAREALIVAGRGATDSGYSSQMHGVHLFHPASDDLAITYDLDPSYNAPPKRLEMFLRTSDAASGGCSALDARHLAPPALVTQNVEYDSTSGVYFPTYTSTAYGITVPTGGLPAGVAFQVPLARALEDPVVTLGAATLLAGEDYLVQRPIPPSNQFVVWFARELAEGVVLTIAEAP